MLSFTKIVATIGPSSNTPEMIERLFQAGVDVFRLNMSHGTGESHAALVDIIRSVSREAGRPAGILCDLSGPKIRIGKIAPEPIMLSAGDEISITAEQVVGSNEIVSINNPIVLNDLQAGQRVLLDDGWLEWEVLSVEKGLARCKVIRGGALSSHKGINLPSTRLQFSSLTDKDRLDIEWGLENDVDMFAVSFVKRAEDIRDARSFMQSLGGNLPLIAKIEKGEAVEDIEAILTAADGAMVARGDLGVEIPLEKVPHVQKKVISMCNRMGKPVITATQMLDSMMRSPRPTRAEVTDVANAILDGSDAVMLSGETAAGMYPEEAVETMERIARETSLHFNYEKRLLRKHIQLGESVQDSIAHAAAALAHDIEAEAILCLTQGGSTPRRIARYRPKGGVLAYCPVARTAQQLCLVWGVRAYAREGALDIEVERRQGTEVQLRKAISLFRDRGVLKSGQRLVVAAGLPLHEPNTTNLLRVMDVD